MTVPSYEFVSAPLWLVTLLHLLTLTLHLAAMGALFGGLAVLLLRRRERQGWTSPAVDRMVRLLPTLMSLTVTLGVAPLLFVQLVYHRQVYAAAIVSGWFWLGIVAAVVVAYYLLYAAAAPGGASRQGLRLTIALVCLLYVSLVLSSVFTLAERPEILSAAWTADPTGRSLNPEIGRWLPRWLHMVTGALTIGAFTLAAFARHDERLFATARRAFLWSMMAAIGLGVATLAGLGEHLAPYLRSSAPWWLLVSLLTALAALHLLFRRRLPATAALLFVSLLAMVVQRHVARLVALGEQFDPATLTVTPQWGIFTLFAVCFLAMLGAIAWMLVLFFGRGGRARGA